MEQLLEQILTGSIRLPLLDSHLAALDRELPKSDWLALLMLQRARDQIDGVLAKIQAVLTPAEVQQLMGLATKILAALQSPLPEPGAPVDSGLKRIAIDD